MRSLVLVFVLLFFPLSVMAENDLIGVIKERQRELTRREAEIRIEEIRLSLLKKDIERKIKQYQKILDELQQTLKALREEENKNIAKVVKTYESMPPEEAALRLAGLDEKIAVKIVKMMKPRKAAKVLASMDPVKVARITKKLTSLEKKKFFPTR